MKVRITEAQYSKLKQRLTKDVSVESLTQNINQLISKVNGMYNIIISSTLYELLNYDLIEKYRNELDNIDSMGSKIESDINDLLGDDWEDMPDNVHLLYKKTHTLNNMLYDIRRIVDRNEEEEQYNLTNLFSDIQTKKIG